MPCIFLNTAQFFWWNFQKKINKGDKIYLYTIHVVSGFPGSSAGKESACKGGDPLVWFLGKIPKEGIGYPGQYSWASLVAQMVKNLPTMLETWVRSLGRENPLEGKATHTGILAWSIPMDRGAWRATVHGVTKSWIQLSD